MYVPPDLFAEIERFCKADIQTVALLNGLLPALTGIIIEAAAGLDTVIPGVNDIFQKRAYILAVAKLGVQVGTDVGKRVKPAHIRNAERTERRIAQSKRIAGG